MIARWISSTVAAACLAIAPFAAAQSASDAKVDLPAAPPAYEDRLIEGGNLEPAVSEELAIYNPEGLARTWRVEGFLSQVEQGSVKRHENGMLLSARLDTVGYGAISVEATARAGIGGTIFTLWQRAMPFDNGWRANNSLGMVNSPTIDLARQQYRFFLPTFPMAGLTTEWLRNGNLQLQASAGEPGTYNGLRLSGFTRLGGRLATAGAQWNPDPNFQAGMQVLDVKDVNASLDTSDPAAKTSARALFGALSWGDRDTRLQFNALDTEANLGSHRMALWFDGESRGDRLRHNYGVFRFDPGLTWGYAPINRDVQGAYYRVSYASQQWIWAAGVDSIGSVSGLGVDGIYGTANLRYQLDHSTGVGGGVSVRRSGTDAAAAYGFVDELTRFGTTRVQVDSAVAQGSQHSEQVSVDQSWPTQVGLRLSTSLSVGREKTPETSIRRMSLAAFGGIDLTNNLSLDGSLRWSVESQSSRTLGRYANLGLVWRISPRWSLIATYYDNRVEVPTFVGIAPLVPVEPLAVVPRDRAIFFTVRYEDHAGTPTAPLGGTPGSGGGALVGWIFYDANDDGRRSASESGAANVTVVLDGRFGVRTGNDGRFEFPLVSAGPHSIVVVPDNLALPYAVNDDGKRDVVIRTRETTTIEIAASRLK